MLLLKIIFCRISALLGSGLEIRFALTWTYPLLYRENQEVYTKKILIFFIYTLIKTLYNTFIKRRKIQ